MKHPSIHRILPAILLVIPFSLGCMVSGLVSPNPTAASATEAPTIAPTQTPFIVTATAEPQSTEAPQPTQPAGVCTQVEHFTICVPTQLTSNLVVSTIPEQTEDQGAPWEVAPQHTQIQLEGYPATGSDFSPVIHIYPVADFTRLAPDGMTLMMDKMKKFMGMPDVDPSTLPYLPFANAASIFQVKAARVENASLHGGSMVTQFAQAYVPINNQSLFYTFQGLTPDEKYWVSVTLPVTQQSLQADDKTIPGGDMDAFANNFKDYVTGIQNTLNQADASTFNPNLNYMEQLVQGITYQP